MPRNASTLCALSYIFVIFFLTFHLFLVNDYIHPFIYSCMHLFFRSFIPSFIHSSIYLVDISHPHSSLLFYSCPCLSYSSAVFVYVSNYFLYSIHLYLMFIVDFFSSFLYFFSLLHIRHNSFLVKPRRSLRSRTFHASIPADETHYRHRHQQWFDS